jgi:hypothetical protein
MNFSPQTRNRRGAEQLDVFIRWNHLRLGVFRLDVIKRVPGRLVSLHV